MVGAGRTARGALSALCSGSDDCEQSLYVYKTASAELSQSLLLPRLSRLNVASMLPRELGLATTLHDMP